MIEMLMVMLIVGLLAGVAVPRYHKAKERVFLSTMKSDLRNFAVAEESYFYDFGVYTPDLGILESRGMQRSEDVTIEVNEATAVGWAATGRHAGTLLRCYLFVGAAGPVGAAVMEGALSCN
ncbi:MAG: hypothetical protein GTO22_06470 [Gemmatimonadales bacterium]|nr:hypothetical protein [Gemmatimonadales bacterium]